MADLFAGWSPARAYREALLDAAHTARAHQNWAPAPMDERDEEVLNLLASHLESLAGEPPPGAWRTG